MLVVGLATVAIKAAGPVLAGDRQLPERTGRMVALVGPALLAALVATQAFGTDEELVLDERGAGLLAAAGRDRAARAADRRRRDRRGGRRAA